MAKPKRNKAEIDQLAANLVRIMAKYKITQKELHYRLLKQGAKCDFSLISQMCTGRTEFSRWLPKICKAIGCDIREFYE